MKATAVLLLSLLLLPASIVVGADPVTVEVTIQSANAEARQITVFYQTGSGQKTIDLDVSSKAEITLNGEKASFQSLGSGLKATVEYHKDLAVVTKIDATGTIRRIDPVVRLKLQVGEFGDVVFSACKTNQAPPDHFEGTVLAVPSLLDTKAWKGANGDVRLVHTFGDATEVKRLAWQSSNVSIDREKKSLVFKPRDKTKKSMSTLSYFQRVRPPATIVIDVAQHDSGPFVVKLLDLTGKWGELYCEITAKKGRTPGRQFAIKALWVERDAQEQNPKISELFNVESTTLDEPCEQKFRFPVPNAKIDQALGIELGKAFDARPTAVARLEVRGQLIPILGIGLNQQGTVVFVKQMFPGGLAERAGIKVGDILTEINAKHPQSVGEAMEALGRVQFGQEVRILVERAGKSQELRFKAM